jgi:phage terminase small subunit
MSNYRPNLNDQQVRFCDEYLVSFNAYRAAIAAGYSENTARKGEMLHEPKIQEYLKLKISARQERLEIDHDMILRELAKIGFGNIGNYYDDQGDLRRMCDLTERDKAALSQYEIMDVRQPDGHRVGTVTKIKMHNKMSALDKIARHLGFYGVAGGRVAGGELRVASLEEEVAVAEEIEEVTVAVAVAVEEEIEEVAAAVEDEGESQEVAVAAAVERKEEFEEDDLDVAVEEGGGKILTLSPLHRREYTGVIDGTFDIEDGTLPDNVDDFVQELLMRGTSD